MTTSPDPSPPATSIPDLDDYEFRVLSLLAVAHPDGLTDEDLRDILQSHSQPCQAADRLVELGLAARVGDGAHWKATKAGVVMGSRI